MKNYEIDGISVEVPSTPEDWWLDEHPETPAAARALTSAAEDAIRQLRKKHRHGMDISSRAVVHTMFRNHFGPVLEKYPDTGADMTEARENFMQVILDATEAIKANLPRGKKRARHYLAKKTDGCVTIHVKAHDRVVCRGARGRFVKKA